MPKIPAEELEALKKDIDLAALVRAKGVELKAHGKDLIGLCPFHQDREPSLVVTPSKNLWHCLGACQTGGDVIEWVQQAEGISFWHAVELLRDGRASRIITSGKVANHSTISRLHNSLTVASRRNPSSTMLTFSSGVNLRRVYRN